MRGVAQGNFERLVFKLEAKDFWSKRGKKPLKQKHKQMMYAQFLQRGGLVEMFDKKMCCFHVGIIAYFALFVGGCGIKTTPYYKTPPKGPNQLFQLPASEQGIQRVPAVPLLDESTLKPKDEKNNDK